ncbi:hypothetical protein AX16_008799 [Volvariella volvacea WC 439]|nr:hypothetical protein AX16_008799 [Volvariella volvacea WC 439]
MHYPVILLNSLVLPIFLTIPAATGYRWPSPQYDALETFLYEGIRADGSSMASLVHPCKTRPSTRASVAAEWLRFTYHDVSTHNIEDGTGGLDASVAYELDREENIGQGMRDSLADFETFPNKYLSRSDVIAIGTIFGIASCGGPIIPFRGGRIDALEAGPFGVPEPHQDLATHTEIFRRQGFSEEDMIALVACGHTMGGVRSPDFPDIVAPHANPNLPGFENFDTTTDFDNAVVTQYLDGTSTNPLVVHHNATLTSDLRIFASDGNATMESLSSTETFMQSCSRVLEQMLNTVPREVTLTEEITLLPAKVYGVMLSIERGRLIFKASLRLTKPLGENANAQRVVTMLWCDKNGSASDCAGTTNFAQSVRNSQEELAISPITSRLGLSFVNYHFVVPIQSEASISKFWFEVDEQDGSSATVYDNEGDGYVVQQDTILFVPGLSEVTFEGSQTRSTYRIVAAVRNGVTPSRVYMNAFDNAMPGFPAPLNTTVVLDLDTSLASTEGYTFYSGYVEDHGSQMTVDLHCEVDSQVYTEDFKHTFSLGNAVSSTPSTVGTKPSQSTPASPSSMAHGRLHDFTCQDFFIYILALSSLLYTTFV